MTKSFKKTPIHKVCNVRAGEEKKAKQKKNRVIRRHLNKLEEPVDLTYHDKLIDLWSMPSDGKTYFGNDLKFKKYKRK
jgi:hypothetical protein